MDSFVKIIIIIFTELTEYADEYNNLVEKTYYASRDLKVHWSDALVTCKAFGMDLVELPLKAEADVFFSLCSQQQYHLNDNYYHVGATYIGAGLNNWYWMTTGKRISYALWYAPGQPDNKDGKEHFLSVYKNGGSFSFNDLDYNLTKWNFFCQHISNSTY